MSQETAARTPSGSPAAELGGDHHVHSTFSDDASSTLEENLAAAEARGLTSLRLVEHVRASTTWLPRFLAGVAALRPPEEMAMRTGVEAKVLDTRGTLDLPDGPLGVDAILVADHQFPGPDGPWSPEATRRRLADGLRVADALDLLVDALVAAMDIAGRRAGTVQLAHTFSLLPKIGLDESDLDDEQVRRWSTAAARCGALVEVNEKWGCPGARLLRAAEEAGARLVAGSDSHVAADVGRYVRVPVLLGEARAP
jgi:putative hydrolase